MTRPLDASHFQPKPRVPLSANASVAKLGARLAEALSRGLSKAGPAPWRVTFEKIEDCNALPAGGDGTHLRFESPLGSLTAHLAPDRACLSALLEAAMGGNGAEAAFSLADRPLSKIEQRVLKLAQAALAAELVAALTEQLGLSVTLFDGNDTPELVSDQGGLARFTFVINLFSYSGEIGMTVARAELDNQLKSGGAVAESGTDERQQRLQQEMGRSEMMLTVTLGPESLLVEQIARLKPGAHVELSSTVTAPVIVWSGNVAAFEGRLARQGERLAVSLTGALT